MSIFSSISQCTGSADCYRTHTHTHTSWQEVSPHERAIQRDLARTFPEHSFFKERDGLGQESLLNVLKAYSVFDREVGYCQGSPFISGLLLMQVQYCMCVCLYVCMCVCVTPRIGHMTAPDPAPSDARGGCILCVCQFDERLSSPRSLQTEHGRSQSLFPPAREVTRGALSKSLPPLQGCGKNGQ